ncbi:MAG: hypothetical protein IT369_14830 [Candidatus Latescibacteria bacterium]|nr:hypothetical protein [Candidatus Latescibacterota bacterium]
MRSVNPLYARRFFFARYQDQLIASGRMTPRPFVEPALPRPYRLVFVGDSTVQGYPHPRRLAAAAFLEAMLQDIWPEQQVEVFNLGITSIASFAVAKVLEDAMALEPDLVVVYTGHNEFYGIYGVGDQVGPRFNRLHYGLMQWSMVQLLKGGFDLLRGQQVSSVDLLKIMAERGEVPLDDPRRPAALNHLRENLCEMGATCEGHRVPLIFCTLVANETGFAPAGAAVPPLGVEEQNQWSAWVEQADRLLGSQQAGAAAAALGLLDQAEQRWADHAWLQYLRGKALVRLGKSQEAAAAFHRARDLDTMPWRAPSRHNEVIREVAAEVGSGVAEVEKIFLQASPAEGIGWELMADHVHPSVRGQALLARAVLSAMAGVPRVPPMSLERVRSDIDYQERLGDLPVERVKTDMDMARLLGEKPMDRYNGANARFFSQRAATGWQNLSSPEQAGAKKWNPHKEEIPLVLEVADQCFAAQDLRRAREYYAAARQEAPFTSRADLWAAVQWAWSTRLLGEKFTPFQEQALREALGRTDFLAKAPDMAPEFIEFVRGELLHSLGEHEAALAQLEPVFRNPEFRRQFIFSLFPALATELIHAGRLDQAREYGRLASAESENPYFIQLVETLSHGGGIMPSR